MKITLGALGPTIAQQVADAGLVQEGVSLDLLDRMSNAVTLLLIHGVLTDAEKTRARNRIVKKLKLRPSSNNKDKNNGTEKIQV